MGIRTFNPTTASRRHMMTSDFAELSDRRREPERTLLGPLPKKGGRNHHGSITVRFQGGRHKRRYRKIDFRRDKLNVPAKVVSIEYDPNRSARIALLHYQDGEKRYILAPIGLEVGATVIAADNADIQPGNSLPLAKIPMGINVHNIELKPGKGGQLARSAGVFAQLMAREGGYVLLRMPSGELRRVNENCRGTVGQVGNLDHENLFIGKAGRARWLGRMPHNRGVSMNPVDHPLGGGEGKAKGGRHPVTPWGQPTKGYKTRQNKRTDKFILQRRAKSKQS